MRDRNSPCCQKTKQLLILSWKYAKPICVIVLINIRISFINELIQTFWSILQCTYYTYSCLLHFRDRPSAHLTVLTQSCYSCIEPNKIFLDWTEWHQWMLMSKWKPPLLLVNSVALSSIRKYFFYIYLIAASQQFSTAKYHVYGYKIIIFLYPCFIFQRDCTTSSFKYTVDANCMRCLLFCHS